MRSIDRLLGRLYNHMSTATVVNCNACRQAVISQEMMDPSSVHVLSNGVDVGRFAVVPPVDHQSPRFSMRVGMVANIRHVKAPEVFVHAAAILARLHSDIFFEIAGTDDEKLAQRLAEDLQIQQRVIVRGTVPDIASFLSTLDVAVLCSHSEGLSNSVLEYMAAGRPIVATNVGGNNELIEDGIHGLLVPAGHSEALARAVDLLLKDRAMAARLGTAARARAEQTYSLAAMVRRHESFYHKLVHPS
jgi:glycosyltransferase involved in cell wall biosynthesis